MTVLRISHRILNPIAAVKGLYQLTDLIKCKNRLETLPFELFGFLKGVE